VVYVRPSKGWLGLNVREIWQYRTVLHNLVWRDIKVRYKQTVLGVSWAILQPLLKMLIFTLVFGRWASLGPEGYPYPIFVFAGMLPWEFFAASLARCSDCIVTQQEFVTKVYFPRLIIPLSAIGSMLLDSAISLLILIALLLHYPQVQVGWEILAVIPLMLLTTLIALGTGVLFAALNVAYRDVRHIIPFIVQVWMFVTPVVYPVTLIPENWRWLLALNPMMGIVAAFRGAIIGLPFEWFNLGISAAVGFGLCLVGIAYFRRTERFFADIV
jgi:lipopolysaccharide transport system permease protein